MRGTDNYEEYTRLVRLISVSPEFVSQWWSYKIMQLLHGREQNSECFMMPALWFLQALRMREVAAEQQFWHCAISSTIVRSSSSTYVFETEDYSNYVEAVAFDG